MSKTCAKCGKDETHETFSRGTHAWMRFTYGPGPYPDEIALCKDCYQDHYGKPENSAFYSNA